MIIQQLDPVHSYDWSRALLFILAVQCLDVSAWHSHHYMLSSLSLRLLREPTLTADMSVTQNCCRNDECSSLSVAVYRMLTLLLLSIARAIVRCTTSKLFPCKRAHPVKTFAFAKRHCAFTFTRPVF